MFLWICYILGISDYIKLSRDYKTRLFDPLEARMVRVNSAVSGLPSPIQVKKLIITLKVYWTIRIVVYFCHLVKGFTLPSESRIFLFGVN